MLLIAQEYLPSNVLIEWQVGVRFPCRVCCSHEGATATATANAARGTHGVVEFLHAQLSMNFTNGSGQNCTKTQQRWDHLLASALQLTLKGASRSNSAAPLRLRLSVGTLELCPACIAPAGSRCDHCNPLGSTLALDQCKQHWVCIPAVRACTR